MKKPGMIFFVFVVILGAGIINGSCNPGPAPFSASAQDVNESHIDDWVDFKSATIEYDLTADKFKVEVGFYGDINTTEVDFVLMISNNRDPDWEYFVRCTPGQVYVKQRPPMLPKMTGIYQPTISGKKFEFEFEGNDIRMQGEVNLEFWFEEIHDYPIIDRMPETGVMEIDIIL